MSSSRENMQLRREVEFRAAMFDREAILEVYETDADLTPNKLIHQGFCLDTAETKMFLAFRASGFQKDFLIYNRKKMENVGISLSNRSKALRGECQG